MDKMKVLVIYSLQSLEKPFVIYNCHLKEENEKEKEMEKD